VEKIEGNLVTFLT